MVTFGAEMAVLASRDGRYRDAVNGADLVVPDTIGIVWDAVADQFGLTAKTLAEVIFPDSAAIRPMTGLVA